MRHQRILRGVLALTGIAFILLGIPVVLVVLAGNPIPESWDAVARALTTPDIGGQFLMTTMVPGMAWIAWGYLVSCLAAEALSYVKFGQRAIRAHRHRNPGRRLASALVSAVAIMIVGSGVALPAQAATPATTPWDHVAVAPATPGPLELDAHEAPALDHADVAESGHVVTVREGDSLWRLAELYLGDGARYPEIAERNKGVVQADGAALDNDLWLTPGWRIELPPDAALPSEVNPDGDDAADQVEHQDGATSTVVVEPGDTLWSIAEEQLGDGRQAAEIARLTGIADPSVIHPGDVVLVPATGDDVVDDAGSAPAPDAVEVAVGASQSEAPSTAHGSSQPQETSGHATGSPSAASDNASADELGGFFNVQTAGGIGGALSAGLLAWLGIRRLAQRRARPTGGRIAMPEEHVAQFEAELRTVSATTSVLQLDLALNTLAAWAQDSRHPMPRFSVARVTAERIVLYLDEAATLPLPFTAGEADGTWAVDPDALVPMTRVPSSPTPALVSLGFDSRDALMFVDLERVGLLSVHGEELLVRDALLALAMELATSPWGADAQLTLVGVDHRLSSELATGRVRHVDDVDALIADLVSRQQHTRQALEELHADSLTDARSLGPDAESWPSEIIFIGNDIDSDVLAQLSRLVYDEPRVGICLVVTEAAHDGWSLRLHDTDSATLHLPDGLGTLDLTPQRLGETEYRHLLELAQVTDRDAHDSGLMRSDADWTLSLPPAPHPTPEADADADAETRDDTTEPVRSLDADADDEAIELPRHDRSAPARPTAIPLLTASFGSEAAPSFSVRDAALAHALEELESDIVSAQTKLAERPRPRVSTPTRRQRGSGRRGDDLDAEARAVLQSLADRPWVRLLGHVALHNPAGIEPLTPQTKTVNASTIHRATELVAYLALHPGATAEQFHAAFWPGKDPRGKTAASNRNGLATRARKWLGASPEGEPYFPHVGTDGYRLHDDVITDWHVFLDLIGERLDATSTPRLRAALDLVQGQPFAGVRERFYGWAEVTRMDILATVSDACHELASRSLKLGDVGTARTSAALAREIDPINEVSWRDALHAELLAGDQEGFERIIAMLERQLDDFEDGYEPEPETQLVIDLGRRSQSVRHSEAIQQS